MKSKVISTVKKNRIEKAIVSPNTKVIHALEKMALHDLGAVLVINDGKISGVFSERDYARKLILEDRASKDTYIEEVMRTKVFVVSPDATLEHCLKLMTENKIRHLVVVDEIGVPIDFVSMRDIVEGMLDEKTFMIDQLNNYISGINVRTA